MSYELQKRIESALDHGDSNDACIDLLVEIKGMLEVQTLRQVVLASPEQWNAARAAWHNNDGEGPDIDDNAAVSVGDDGFWIEAWLWVGAKP